jgi:NagD protein
MSPFSLWFSSCSLGDAEHEPLSISKVNFNDKFLDFRRISWRPHNSNQTTGVGVTNSTPTHICVLCVFMIYFRLILIGDVLCLLGKAHGTRVDTEIVWFFFGLENMSSSIAFLIDMDGVVYRESELIPGADEFIEMLIQLEIPFMFLTNNSQRSRRDILHKLLRLGINVTMDHIFTCSMATARFLAKQNTEKTAYVIGEGGLLNALHLHSFAIDEVDPQYVIIGEGKTLNMNMIEQAANYVLKGAKLIATNLDPNCPTEKGTRPGCGATTAMIELTTGRKAFSAGKPSPIIFSEAIYEMNAHGHDIYMIGDTMDTDILGAVQSQLKSILVLSGTTSEGDLERFAFSPTHVVSTIADVIQLPEMSINFTSRRPRTKKTATSPNKNKQLSRA